jgi:predicted enzyme related to lactoylglutathione lyase
MKTLALLLVSAAALGAARLAPADDAAEGDRAARREALGYLAASAVVLPVGDLEAALAWYGKVLGFETLFVEAPIGFAELATPVAGQALGLSQRPEATHGDTAVTFGVRDVAAARARLEASGVTFEGEIVEYPGLVKLAHFADPWGNRLILHQSLQEERR